MGILKSLAFGFAILAVSIVFFIVTPNRAAATTGINSEISFEGKIVTTAGLNIPDNTYNMEFKIYPASGTCNPTTGSGCAPATWTEDWLVSNSQGVTFSSGTYQVNLGSICPFSGGTCGGNTNTAINWNSYPLYLSLQIGSTTSCTPAGNFKTNCGGDTEMLPYISLTSTPYAFNSNELSGLTSSAFGQLALGSQTWTSSNIFQPTTDVAGLTVMQNSTASPTADILDVESANSTKVIQVSSSGANNASIVINAEVTSGTGLSLQSGTGSNINIGTTNNNTIGVGNSNSTINLAGTTNIAVATGKAVAISVAAAPTANIVTITNAGQPDVTANVAGLNVNYTGGSAAVESEGLRIDFTPGGTSGGTWDGLRIVANTTGPATGVIEYGLKLEGPGSAGLGTAEAAYIGSGWNIGLDIQSGGIQLASQTTPTTPSTGNLRIYAQSTAGRMLPYWVGPSGVNTPFQANLGFNRVSLMMPAGGATLTTFVGGFGSTFTNTGTAANPTPTSTNLFDSVRRATFSTGATAGTVASHRQSVLQVWRGNAAGLGGFFFTIRFGTDTLATGNRAFVGMADSVAAPTNVDPTTNTTPGKIGMAINASTGDWNFVNNVTGTAPTVTSLGSSFPVNTTDLYQLTMFCQEDGSVINYLVNDISSGTSTTGSVSTNIPANTTFLSPQFWITNNATAAAAILDFSGWYLESDN